MWPNMRLYSALAGALLVALALFYVHHLRTNITDLTAQVQVLTDQKTELIRRVDQANQSLEDLKISGEILEKQRLEAISKADEARKKAEQQLVILRRQKPPVECKATIDWAIQQKDDLKW